MVSRTGLHQKGCTPVSVLPVLKAYTRLFGKPLFWTQYEGKGGSEPWALSRLKYLLFVKPQNCSCAMEGALESEILAESSITCTNGCYQTQSLPASQNYMHIWLIRSKSSNLRGIFQSLCCSVIRVFSWNYSS